MREELLTKSCNFYSIAILAPLTLLGVFLASLACFDSHTKHQTRTDCQEIFFLDLYFAQSQSKALFKTF